MPSPMTAPTDLYKLVDEHGDGLLIPWVKYAKKTGDYGILEEYFDTMVKDFLYNDGKGKLVPISELVMIRNKQRNAVLGALRRKKGRGKSGPNILLDLDQGADHCDKGSGFTFITVATKHTNGQRRRVVGSTAQLRADFSSMENCSGTTDPQVASTSEGASVPASAKASRNTGALSRNVAMRASASPEKSLRMKGAATATVRRAFSMAARGAYKKEGGRGDSPAAILLKSRPPGERGTRKEASEVNTSEVAMVEADVPEEERLEEALVEENMASESNLSDSSQIQLAYSKDLILLGLERLFQNDHLKRCYGLGILKTDSLKILDGCIRGNRSVKYRELVWDVEKRGKMGENLLHICLLHNTVDHNDLAKLLVKRYPKMVNDIFISEEYYGFSPLHQAIVNEDVEMVYFMCRNHADVHQRCYGSFFCAEDQKSSRTDSLEHEWVDLVHNTRYTGQMYWGEYPLSFAACTNQPDCFRLLRACKADPNQQDTNGNTVLHMAVIHELPEMFRLAHESGAKLHMKNYQKLTPMGVAAKLAKKEMFDLILELEQDILWTYGDVICTAFPLQGIDTIDQVTGHLNHTSALSLVVYGKKNTHLDFFDGLLEDLLEEKWKAFARNRLIWSMTSYLVYLLCFYAAFMTRSCFSEREMTNVWVHANDTHTSLLPRFFMGHFSYLSVPFDYDVIGERCHLWNYKDPPGDYTQRIRLASEVVTLLFASAQTAREVMDIGHGGRKRWWEVTRSFPAKMLHKFGFSIVVAMLPLRFSCALNDRVVLLENTCAIVAVLATTFHLFFFCRGMKFVGPFVLMVYKIIIGDMLRFLLIYLIFLISFSQSCFVIFKSCEREHLQLLREQGVRSNFENIMSTPIEAVMRMFLVSVGEFGAFYKNVHDCPSRHMSVLAKVGPSSSPT
uniref:ANK_REP_REGION domain-containing protein n=1 Tax=Steinernema glaseri TaxID=37863 RepID=A0A1I7ZKR4_9BILA